VEAGEWIGKITVSDWLVGGRASVIKMASWPPYFQFSVCKIRRKEPPYFSRLLFLMLSCEPEQQLPSFFSSEALQLGSLGSPPCILFLTNINASFHKKNCLLCRATGKSLITDGVTIFYFFYSLPAI
jgi:hypothetical protein